MYEAQYEGHADCILVCLDAYVANVSHLCSSDASAYLYIRTLASELPH